MPPGYDPPSNRLHGNSAVGKMPTGRGLVVICEVMGSDPGARNRPHNPHRAVFGRPLSWASCQPGRSARAKKRRKRDLRAGQWEAYPWSRQQGVRDQADRQGHGIGDDHFHSARWRGTHCDEVRVLGQVDWLRNSRLLSTIDQVQRPARVFGRGVFCDLHVGMRALPGAARIGNGVLGSDQIPIQVIRRPGQARPR